MVAVIGLSGAIGSAFSDNFASGNSASQRAQNLLAQRFPAQAGDSADVVVHTSGLVKDPANAATIDRMVVGPPPATERDRGAQPPGTGRSPAGVRRRAHRIRGRSSSTSTTPNLKTSADTKHLVNVAQSFAHPGFEVALGGNPISATVSPHPRAPAKASASRPPS